MTIKECRSNVQNAHLGSESQYFRLETRRSWGTCTKYAGLPSNPTDGREMYLSATSFHLATKSLTRGCSSVGRSLESKHGHWKRACEAASTSLLFSASIRRGSGCALISRDQQSAGIRTRSNWDVDMVDINAVAVAVHELASGSTSSSGTKFNRMCETLAQCREPRPTCTTSVNDQRQQQME